MENTHTAGWDFYFGMELWASVVASVVLTVCCVLFHYEMFRLLAYGVKHFWRTTRIRIVYVVLGLMVFHTAEIWLFAFGYYFLSAWGVGALQGLSNGLLFEYVYYSAMVYTTVGFGDITPIGVFKLLTGMEALVGLGLITWSASFTLLEMRTTWMENLR